MVALRAVGESECRQWAARRTRVCASMRAAVLHNNEEQRRSVDEESGETMSGLEECPMRVLMEIDDNVRKLASADHATLSEGVNAIRRIISVEHSPPIAEVVAKGSLPMLVKLMDNPDTHVQHEAAWALTNVASGANRHVLPMLKFGAVEKFVELLSSASATVAEQAVWALGNVAGDSYECRDFVLAKGALQPLLELTSEDRRPSLRRNAIWTVSNLFRGQPPPLLSMLVPCIPTVAKLIHSGDDMLVADAVWCLAYFCSEDDVRIGHLYQAGVIPLIVNALVHPSLKVQVPALRVIGSVLSGPDNVVEPLLQLGVLPALLHVLRTVKPSLQREVFWAISNIAAGELSHVRTFVASNLFGVTVQFATHNNDATGLEALWALANATTHAEEAQDLLDVFLEQGLVGALYSKLSSPNAKATAVAMEGIHNCVMASGQGIDNKFAEFFSLEDGCTRLKRLLNHRSRVGAQAREVIEHLSAGMPV